MQDFYVYIHLRADSGLPFYIGKGRRRRAWCRSDRSEYWKRVAKKHGVIVELLHAGLSEDAAFALEKKEIAWARQYYDLVNVCDGGEGSTRSSVTEENKKNILNFFEERGRWPAQTIPEEHTLWKAMVTYRSPSSNSYDPDFCDVVAQAMNNRRAGIHVDRVNAAKQEIISFVRAHGRVPSQRRESEVDLHRKMTSYCSPTSKSYDAEFREFCESMGFAKDLVQESVDRIKAFFDEVGRLPDYRSPGEAKLRQKLARYIDPKDTRFRPDVLQWAVERGYTKVNTKETKEAILRFIEANKRKPRRAEDSEKRLARALESYTSKNHNSYDPEFSEEIQKTIKQLKEKF